MRGSGHPIGLQLMHHNFVRTRETLSVTPAMSAGVSDRVWEISDIVALLDSARSQKNAESKENRELRAITNKGPALGF